jgi:hypothetical protein
MGLRFNPFTGNLDFDGGAPGPGAAYSDDLPAELGAAAAGMAAEASRSDHVHEMPSAADVGAVASDTTGIAGALAIANLVQISGEDYDALASVDPATIYIVER